MAADPETWEHSYGISPNETLAAVESIYVAFPPSSGTWPECPFPQKVFSTFSASVQLLSRTEPLMFNQSWFCGETFPAVWRFMWLSSGLDGLQEICLKPKKFPRSEQTWFFFLLRVFLWNKWGLLLMFSKSILFTQLSFTCTFKQW